MLPKQPPAVQPGKQQQWGQRRSVDHLDIFINTGDVHVNIFVCESGYYGSIFQPIGDLKQKNAPSGRHGLIQATNTGFVSIQQDSLQLCRRPLGLN